MSKEEYISYLYKVHNTEFASGQVFITLLNIEKNLTDKMYDFLVDKKIEFDYLTLNIFCQTNMLVECFKRFFKKTYYENYLDYNERLENIANRIQFYSESQIEITFPKYTFDKNTIVHIFINYLKDKNIKKTTLESIKRFYTIRRLKSPVPEIQEEINSYLINKTYKPNIELSHMNLLKSYYPLESFKGAKIDTLGFSVFIKSIDDKFRNYRNKFHNFKFNKMNKAHWAIKYLNSKYEREDIHYWDINTNTVLLAEIKKYITYDIYMHLKDYNIINQIDLFTLDRFISTVHTYKLTKYENTIADDTKFYNLNYLNFRT